MKKIYSVFLFVVVFSRICAQVSVDKSIQLNGTTASDRQIENLYDSVLTTDITSAITIQNNLGRYGIATGVDSISVLISSGLQFYTAGSIVYFKAAANNTGSVVLSINGLPFFPLKMYGTDSLKANQLKASQIYCAVFSGTEFQLLSNVNNDCRTGFVEVNSTYCIEINERTATYFYQAAMNCNAENARLCRWGEWYYACQKAGVATVNMTNSNWEWTDDAANATVRVAGLSSCTALNVSNVTTTTLRPYRCCYTK